MLLNLMIHGHYLNSKLALSLRFARIVSHSKQLHWHKIASGIRPFQLKFLENALNRT